MSEKKLFLLPDLGEGLPDAEIVEWLVKVGDVVKLDEPLVSMETAKAVVEVPSPFSGKVTRLAGGAGDVIATGSWLVEVEIDPSLPQRADAQDTGHSHGHGGHAAPPPAEPAPAVGGPSGPTAAEAEAVGPEGPPTKAASGDAGTVVGAMQSSDAVRSEQAVAVGGVKAMPAVRALAKKLKVDLARVRPTGADGVVTMADVKQAAAAGSAPLGATPAPMPRTEAPRPAAPTPAAPAAPAAGRPAAAFDVDEPIRGVRRNMVRSMSQAHAEVVPTTLMDDADIHAWAPGEDIMARMIRAIVVASAVEPAMNAWLNAKEGTLRRHARVDVGIAVDSADGLFVANLRNAERLEPHQVRQGINRIRDGVKNRSLPPEELRDYTIMLSNFGVFAGKYATPVVVPPCVAIIGAGRLHHAVVPVLGGLETHRIMPISLTFDHRAATGGEAARFLRALLDDLQEGPLMAHHSRLAGFIIDCEQAPLDEAARFWSAALGLPVIDPDEGGEGRYARLDGSRHGLHIEVQRVEHPSRVHLDVESDDIEAEAARLVALGATEVARPRGGRWIVLQAPTGQRFCVVRAREPLHAGNASAYP